MSRSARKVEEISIFTDEPVPKDSREFWDKILAGAGTSSGVASALTPQASGPSAAATVQGNRADATGALENVRSLGEALISLRSPLSSHVSEGSPISPSSLERHASLESSESERDPTSSNAEIASTMIDEAGETLETMSRTSPRPEKEESRCQDLPNFPNQMDLDGPADVGSRWRKYRKRSSLVHLLGESVSRSIDSPDRSQSPRALPKATSLSLSLTESEPRSIGMPFGNYVRMAEWSATRLRRANLFEGSVSNSLPSKDTQLLSTRESIQPQLDVRSSPPRNVSQSTDLKTPEQPYNSAIDLNGSDNRGETRLLSLPPRRKRGYRRRSQTYSYLQSAGSLEVPAQCFDPRPYSAARLTRFAFCVCESEPYSRLRRQLALAFAASDAGRTPEERATAHGLDQPGACAGLADGTLPPVFDDAGEEKAGKG
ncbi:MAG: hypothetical protein LQ351_001365 [Letrouitia transgressa]|nr:MAG: hypothetical protein LQ351_001365 [Letrouitia transgressa]